MSWQYLHLMMFLSQFSIIPQSLISIVKRYNRHNYPNLNNIQNKKNPYNKSQLTKYKIDNITKIPDNKKLVNNNQYKQISPSIYQIQLPYIMQTPQIAEQSQSPLPHDQPSPNQKPSPKKPKYQHHIPQLQRNPDLITIDTILPQVPKKNQLIPKPNIKQYQDKQSKTKQKINQLLENKKLLFQSKFMSHLLNDKSHGNIQNDFNHQVLEYKDLQDKYKEVKNQRNVKKDRFDQLIAEAKQKNSYLKQLKQSAKMSKQSYEIQLQKLQHRLLTSQLSKKEQTALNNQIIAIKRKLRDAIPQQKTQATIEAIEKRKQQLQIDIKNLKSQRQPLQQQFKQIREQLSAKNEYITKIKGEMSNQKDEKIQAKQKNHKQYEQWKETKKKKMQDINIKITQLNQSIKNLWKQYHNKNDIYWEQKHKIDFIQWQYRIKQKKIKQFNKQIQKIQHDKIKTQNIAVNLYQQEIQNSNSILNYLNNYHKQNNKQAKVQKIQQDKDKDINTKLGQNQQWQKQKGIVLIQSKKTKQDDQPIKKSIKKGKKKQQKADKGQKPLQQRSKKLQIPLNIYILFDSIKILPPQSSQQLAKKIQQIIERKNLFMRVSTNEASQQDKQIIQKINNIHQKIDQLTPAKKLQEEFPTL